MKPFVAALIFILFGGYYACAQADQFQLATPFLHYNSIFFGKKATITLEFAQPGTQIHYTLNGQEPTVQDPVYTRPLHLKKHQTILTARVFGAGFLPSDIVTATFYKKGLPIKKISHTPPDKQYPGSGTAALNDGLGGIVFYKSKTWLGFQTDSVVLDLTLSNPQQVHQVLLHVLQHQSGWIFGPQKISIYHQQKDSGQLYLLQTTVFDPGIKDDAATCQAIWINLPGTVKTEHLLIKIYPLAQLPDWHPGKGTRAWLFIDEVKLY